MGTKVWFVALLVELNGYTGKVGEKTDEERREMFRADKFCASALMAGVENCCGMVLQSWQEMLQMHLTSKSLKCSVE